MSENLKPLSVGDEIKDFYLRGNRALDRKAVSDAEYLFEKALKAYRNLDRQARVDEQLSVALSLDQLASLARSQGKYDIAIQRYQESAELYGQLATQTEAEGRQDITKKARLQGKAAQQLAKDLAAEKSRRPTLDPIRGDAAPSRANAEERNLPSHEQADALYREALMAEKRGESSSADQLYRRIAQLYDVMQQDASVASTGLAASLYMLGYHAAHRGDIFFGMNYYRKAAEVFQAIAQAAEAQSNAEKAADARREAEHIFSLADELAEKCDKVLSSPKSEKHEMQEKWMAQLDQDRARMNQNWAQGLGRI